MLNHLETKVCQHGRLTRAVCYSLRTKLKIGRSAWKGSYSPRVKGRVSTGDAHVLSTMHNAPIARARAATADMSVITLYAT